jgi:hypothetical protein
MKAPRNSPARYTGTLLQVTPPLIASAIVTAGFRCPLPPTATDVNTPTNTAIAQAVVMTIQPELLPLVLLNKTLATTPSPSRIRNIVPITSPIKMFIV